MCAFPDVFLAKGCIGRPWPLFLPRAGRGGDLERPADGLTGRSPALWMVEPSSSSQIICLLERKTNLTLLEPCILEGLLQQFSWYVTKKTLEGKTSPRVHWLVHSAFFWVTSQSS